MKATTGPQAQQGHQQKQGCLKKYCSEESNRMQRINYCISRDTISTSSDDSIRDARNNMNADSS
jgi:hypothetical protein